MDHFRWRVPDTELLAQVRVEGFEERLVEVGHRLTFVEAGEEGGLVHPVERRRRPVQHFDQAERLQAAGVGKLLEQRPQHRRAQMPDRGAPIKLRGVVAAGERRPVVGLRTGARPQHPGREDAVEQGLHQGRMEETRALLTLETHPERLFERRAHRLQRRRVACHLDPRETVAGIGREQPCQVLRLGQSSSMGQHATEVFTQTRADLTGEGARCLQPALERRLAAGQLVGFERCLVTRRVLAYQYEFAQVGRQHQAIAGPISSDLLAYRPCLHVLV